MNTSQDWQSLFPFVEDFERDFPQYINFRRIPGFQYPDATFMGHEALYESLPRIGKNVDAHLIRFTKLWIRENEAHLYEACYNYDMKRVDMRTLCQSRDEEGFRLAVKQHYLVLHQAYGGSTSFLVKLKFVLVQTSNL